MGLYELSHPTLRSHTSTLESILHNSATLFDRYPELQLALDTQLPGLVSRDQMYAHNVSHGSTSLAKLRKGEGWEVVDSVLKNILAGEKIGEDTSLEGADFLVFGSIEAKLAEVEGVQLPVGDRLGIEVGLIALRAMRYVWPEFDHVAAIPKTVRKNWELNYPVTSLKAPAEWDMEKMTDYYLTVTKPGLRALRNVFGGLIPPEVTEHLNEKRENPPDQFLHYDDFANQYLRVLTNIPV